MAQYGLKSELLDNLYSKSRKWNFMKEICRMAQVLKLVYGLADSHEHKNCARKHLMKIKQTVPRLLDNTNKQ